MVRDRMPDLQGNLKEVRGSRRSAKNNVGNCENKLVDKVLKEAVDDRRSIELLRENIDIVKSLHNNVLAHTDKDMQKELENRTYVVSRMASRIKNKLKDMGKDFNLSNSKGDSALTRITFLQYSTMLQIYTCTMQEYNSSLVRFHDKSLLLLYQEKSIISKNLASEDLDSLLDFQETNLFVDNILEDSRIEREKLLDIQTRHSEIVELEKSIKEIHDIFLEMAFLVEEQGEKTNNIEYIVNKTTDHVHFGREELAKAEINANRYRKNKIKLSIAIGVLVILLLIFLVLYLK